jgi:group I intron endonuclease
MLYIYKFTNKINSKSYIGQTNNIEKRKRGHKSDSYNAKSHSYKLPFHNAIRKYGWENFKFEIIEEIPDEMGRDYLNEREIFFIDYFKTLTTQNGYNLTVGGDGCAKPKKTFEECCKVSKILNEEQVRDIQRMLCEKYQYFEIQKKYPFLKDSFLQNINTGWNFRREDLDYPLLKGSKSRRYSKELKEKIIEELKTSRSLTEIAKEYHISRSYLSQINKGDKWFDPNNNYPLYDRSKDSWSKKCKYDIIFSNMTLLEISKKYNICYSTIKKINSGKSRVDKNLYYPLNKNKEKNQKILDTLS